MKNFQEIRGFNGISESDIKPVEEATDVYDKEGVQITRYSMGKGKGVGYQLNYGGKYIQIPMNQMKAVMKGLNVANKSR